MWREVGAVSVSVSAFRGALVLRVAPGLDPLELLGDGSLDDRGQVAVRHLGAHQGREPLELVAELARWR